MEGRMHLLVRAVDDIERQELKLETRAHQNSLTKNTKQVFESANKIREEWGMLLLGIGFLFGEHFKSVLEKIALVTFTFVLQHWIFALLVFLVLYTPMRLLFRKENVYEV